MARASRCFVFCCLVLVVSVINAETSEETAAAAANATGTCIAESDYTSLQRKVEELQSRNSQLESSGKELDQTKSELAKVKSQLEDAESQLKPAKSQLEHAESQLKDANSQLEAVSTEKTACDGVSANLFQRVKETEATTENLKLQFEEQSKEVKSCRDEVEKLNAKTGQDVNICKESLQQVSTEAEKCKKEVEELNERTTNDVNSCKREVEELDKQKSAALTECQTKVTQSNQELIAAADLAESSKNSAERKLREQEIKSNADLNFLKEKMAKAEAQNKADKNRLEKVLSKTQKDGEEAAALREKLSEESYLFSFAQFKRVLLKVAAIDKALVLFISSKVQAVLPPTLSEDVRVQYAQMRLGLKEYYTTYVESHVNYMTEMTAPYIAVVKKVYDENAGEHVEQTRQVATNLAVLLWDNGKIKAQEYFEYINGWIEAQFIQPFAQSHQVVQELIPKSPTDRLFALIFLIVAMLISAYFMRFIFRYFVKPVFKILKIAFLLPCSLAGFLCCRRRKAATKPVAVSAKKIVPPVKKESRKESPVKQQQKQNSKKDDVKKEPAKKWSSKLA